MNSNIKIDKLISDRNEFNKFVYTSLEDAVKEIKNRQSNELIDDYLKKNLPSGIPEVMINKKSVVLFRHIATSNYEILRFLSLTSILDKFQQIIFEYTEDKFTNRNESKFFLGKMTFVNGMNKNNEIIFESQNIINFNESNLKKISSIKTVWGQSLVDFHHEMFFKFFPNLKGHVFDLSKWIHENGDGAKKYYKFFLSLFLKNGILFENFLLENSELAFTKEVILPVIIEIEKETGIRPIIVALEPTDIEGEKFWFSHPHNQKIVLTEKMEPNKINHKNFFVVTKKLFKDISYGRGKIFTKFFHKIYISLFNTRNRSSAEPFA